MAPELPQDLWRRIFAFLLMQWRVAAALALSFEEGPHRPRRDGHDETGGPQQWLSGIRLPVCEFNEAMAHKWGFANQQMLGFRVALMPLRHCLTRPETRGLADYRMRNALDYRIVLSGETGFKHWSGYVPLQHMHRASQGIRQVGELMTQQTLARTRETSKEHAALCAGQPLQVSIEPWVCGGNEESMGERCSTHQWKHASM
jgi:hypothetical protein